MISLKTLLAAGLFALSAGVAQAAGEPLQGASHDGDDRQISERYKVSAQSAGLFGRRAVPTPRVVEGRASAAPRRAVQASEPTVFGHRIQR